MLRVLMLDLGDTLVRGEVPLPHVPEALAVIQGLSTSGGEPVERCLVSDFGLARTPAEVDARFAEYLALLGRAGLAGFFEPPERRVTLSVHAGATKPDRRVFETALARLGGGRRLDETLFVTEAVAHVAAARNLGMRAMTFGPRGDVRDWAEGALQVAHAFAGTGAEALRPALDLALQARAARLVDVQARAAGRLHVSALVLHPTSVLVPGTPDPTHVEVPVEGDVTFDPRGRAVGLDALVPSATTSAEASSFVHSLAVHGQVEWPGGARGGDPGPGPATHRVERDETGRYRLERKGFSAI